MMSRSNKRGVKPNNKHSATTWSPSKEMLMASGQYGARIFGNNNCVFIQVRSKCIQNKHYSLSTSKVNLV